MTYGLQARLPTYVGSIFITEKSAFCSLGKIDQAYESFTDNTFPRVEEIEKIELKKDDFIHLINEKNTPEIMLHKSIDWLFESRAYKIDVIVIGCFGPFISLDLTHPNYGTLQNITSHKEWQNAQVYKIARNYLVNKHYDAVVRINTEVDLAALGEFWHRIFHKNEQQICPSGIPRNEPAAFISKSIHVFIKVSKSINAGIAYGGGPWKGRQHPLISALKPKRMEVSIPSETNKDGKEIITDPFPGICEVHGDCIEGLIGLDAIEARCGGQKLFDLPAMHPIWDIIAYYVANLCVHITTVIAPSLIILGGRIIDNAPKEANLLDKIRDNFFEDLIGVNGRLSPDYPELHRRDHFIQTLSHANAGTYGGLIIAEREVIKNSHKKLRKHNPISDKL